MASLPGGTPGTPSQFVASKLIPFWIIALVDLGPGLILARLVFDIPIAGSLSVVAVSALAYLFVALGIALWISTVVETQQQAMFIAFTVTRSGELPRVGREACRSEPLVSSRGGALHSRASSQPRAQRFNTERSHAERTNTGRAVVAHG